MDLEGIMLSEISQKQKDQNCEFPLLLGIQNSQTQKQRVKWWLPGPGGGEGCWSKGTRAQFCMRKHVLEMDGGGSGAAT